MPFDFKDYQQKVHTLTDEQLQKEWENYTRQMAGAATSTGTAILFSPLTAGVSLIGLGLSTPRIHNARKKRAMIEANLQARGTTHNTRKRDVLAPAAISGVIAGATLGLAGPGADLLGGTAAEKGAEYVVAHVALEGTGAVIEHVHTDHAKREAEYKLHMKMQNEALQQQHWQHQQIIPIMQQNGQYTSQPGHQVPQYQPQYQAQIIPQPGYEPTYAPVPIPAAHNSGSYQPASHQQQFLQQVSQTQMAHANTQAQTAYQPAAHPTYYQNSNQQNGNQYSTASSQTPYEPQLQQQLPNIEACVPQQPVTQQDDQVQEKFRLVTVPSSMFSAQAGPIDQSYFPEKSAAYNASIPHLGQDSSPAPAPAYEESPAVTPDQDVCEETCLPEMTIEEELALLKARLMAMELEKRGLTATMASPEKAQSRPMSVMQSLAAKTDVVVSVSALQSELVPAEQTPTLQVTTLSAAATATAPEPKQEECQTPASTALPVSFNIAQSLASVSLVENPPSPPQQPEQTEIPASASLSVSMDISHQSASIPLVEYPPPPPSQQIDTIPPTTNVPLPSPSPAVQCSPQQPSIQPYQPQPQSINSYNPQNYPPPPPRLQTFPKPSPSPHSQPGYQRQDSGYYSAVPSPMPQQYNTALSPQTTGGQYYHGRSPSVSTMSPPPPYFPPPSGASAIGNGMGKDYFGGVPNMAPPGGQRWGQPPQQTYQGTQGWQWGVPAGPIPLRQEPQYGPPPPIPNAWRGS